MLPGDFDSLLEFLDAHFLRLENHMLAVVKLPVFGEDSVLSQQPFIKGRVRKRRYHGKARQINFCRDGKLGCFQKNIRRSRHGLRP